MAGEIDQIVQVTILANSATPQKPNFGTPAIVVYHTHYTDRIRTYFDLAGMVADGFTTVEPAYAMAQAIVSQSPRPPSFKVIRATTAVAQAMTFKVTDNTSTDVVGFTLKDATGVTRTVQTTVTPGETLAQVATALAAIAVPGAVLTVDGGDSTKVDIAVTATGTAWPVLTALGGNFTDVTPSAAPDADLTAALLIDNQWYGVAGQSFSATNIGLLAAWVEANHKILAYTTADTADEQSGGGVFATLKAAGYARSYGQYSNSPGTYPALGLMAQRLTADPGSDTWAYKQIAGSPVDNPTPTQISYAQANNGNIYMNVAGVNATLWGVAASGLYMDITRGIDALAADMQIRIFNLLVSNPKVPYTRRGIGAICAEVLASLLSFTKSATGDTAFLSNESGFEPKVMTPDLTLVNPVDKKQRLLKNVNWVAYAQGAVQTVQINGTVNL